MGLFSTFLFEQAVPQDADPAQPPVQNNQAAKRRPDLQ
jgi:hypothetical protein